MLYPGLKMLPILSQKKTKRAKARETREPGVEGLCPALLLISVLLTFQFPCLDFSLPLKVSSMNNKK